jgi:SAM-dependent methyltransferase
VLQTLRDLARGGDRRRSSLLRLLRPKGLFQPFGDTFPDRYPEIFARVAQGVADTGGAILSVGCSTGEEVFTLRRYFPHATIKGLDISPQRIAICRERAATLNDPGLHFAVAGDTDGEPDAHYDAIFAMAVFRHGRLAARPARCTPLLSFERFEAAATSLARCLKPGGHLAVRHANFRFEDTLVAREFTPLMSAAGVSPLYGRDDRLLPAQSTEACVFVKSADAAGSAAPSAAAPEAAAQRLPSSRQLFSSNSTWKRLAAALMRFHASSRSKRATALRT